jgi:hypothetical protein
MRREVVIALVVSAVACQGGVAHAAPGDLRLATASATGVASNGESLMPSVSPDGTMVAFFSTATNLHPADSDPGPDVYVKNVRTGDVILASRAANGAKGNGDSRLPVISADLSGDGRRCRRTPPGSRSARRRRMPIRPTPTPSPTSL